MADTIYTAPPGTGHAVLGKTLTALLYEACAAYPNPHALNQPVGDGWKAWSLEAFREEAEALARGLLGLGLERGDRVAFFMESDVYFCLADMGCLLAGLVDVPVYITHAPEAVHYVFHHAEVRAVVVSSRAHLAQVAKAIADTPSVEHVVVAEPLEEKSRARLPERVAVHDFDGLMARGRESGPDVEALRAQVRPHDLATIIYTSGTTGRPKGVMLTHENISYNGLTSFTGLPDFQPGADGELGLSFLPLTHIFARTLHYGFLAFGTSVYFSDPERLSDDLLRVRPTVFATVPRVLEKVYSRILERATTLTGAKKKLLNWALDVAGQYELGQEPSVALKAELALADRLVFGKWREALGGRVKYIICGGAALSGDLANLFAAAGVNVLQGYGLTETSPVITFNRPGRNRAGTVGEPIPGLEVKIAGDGEILTRGPHVMQGYFRDEEKTREVLDDDGWLHTGDIGDFTDEGFLRITDRKKDLFKLSTAKYVMPQPLENKLTAHPLIEQAVVVGAGRKYPTALIFPDQDTLAVFATSRGVGGQPVEALLREPVVVERYRQLVAEANEGMDPWSTIKRFALIPDHLSVENGLLTPTLKVRRPQAGARYQAEIDALYAPEPPALERGVIVVQEPLPAHAP